MKKIFLALFVAASISLSAQAQKNTFGLRTEYAGGLLYGGLSYQHAFGEKWQMELDAMTTLNSNYTYLALIGLAQYRMPITGNLYAVLGAGAEVGYAHSIADFDRRISPSVVAQIGLTYRFDKIPIDLSLDIRPRVFMGADGKLYPMMGSGIGIALRPPKPHKPEPKYNRTEYSLVEYVD